MRSLQIPRIKNPTPYKIKMLNFFSLLLRHFCAAVDPDARSLTQLNPALKRNQIRGNTEKKSTTRLTWILVGTRPRLWRPLLPKHRWKAPRFLLFPSCKSLPPTRVNAFKPREQPKARVTGPDRRPVQPSYGGGGGSTLFEQWRKLERLVLSASPGRGCSAASIWQLNLVFCIRIQIGSGIRQAKTAQVKIKRWRNFMFWSGRKRNVLFEELCVSIITEPGSGSRLFSETGSRSSFLITIT